MDNYNKEKRNRDYYNPHLLITGGFTAIGGLLIYSIIAWIAITFK